MTAIDWVRSKATQCEQYVLSIAPEEAVECEPGDYQVTRWKFEGRVPYRMAQELRKTAGATLVKTDAENETLTVGGQYRSEEGNCRYYRATYEKLN